MLKNFKKKYIADIDKDLKYQIAISIMSELEKAFIHKDNDKKLEHLTEIIETTIELSNSIKLKNALKDFTYDRELIKKNLFVNILTQISLIKDIKIREIIFIKTSTLLHEIGYLIEKEEIKKILSSFYVKKTKNQINFILKKFPEVKMDEASFTKDLILQKLKSSESQSPGKKIEIIEKTLAEYFPKNPILEDKSHIGTHLIENILKERILVKSISLVEKLVNNGGLISIKALVSMKKATVDKKFLEKIKNLFISYPDLSEKSIKNNGEKFAVFLDQLYSNNSEWKKEILESLNVKPDFKLSVLEELITHKNFDNYPIRECNDYTGEGNPLFFAIFKAGEKDPEKIISFLKKNNIDYNLTNNENQSFIEFIQEINKYNKPFFLSKDEKIRREHCIKKIALFCEQEILNSKSIDEFNL